MTDSLELTFTMTTDQTVKETNLEPSEPLQIKHSLSFPWYFPEKVPKFHDKYFPFKAHENHNTKYYGLEIKNLHEYPPSQDIPSDLWWFMPSLTLPRAVIRLSVTWDPGKVPSHSRHATSAMIAADAALDAELYHHYRRMPILSKWFSVVW